MNIAIVKPDFKITGGFEIVIDRIIKGLTEYGHKIDYLKIDITKPKYKLGEITIPENIYNLNKEFFRYMLSIEEFQNLKLDNYDLVISTQPPSFMINHRKVVVLFYHHLKLYYDLFDVYVECGFEREEILKKSAKIVRDIDNIYLTDDKYYLAGSNHVADRLKKYNNISKHIYLFNAGIDEEYYEYNGKIEYNYPICVGRHEFPKRTELFIHAINHTNGLKGKVIGEGGRTETLKIIDKYLAYLHGILHDDIDDDYLWKKLMFNVNKINLSGIPFNSIKTNVIFTGKVTKSQLIKEYASALCVVCPSFEEDYGLTALEAMSFRKPVIACNDGGGYTEFIKHGDNGFIVEPKGEAIADVINYLNNHKDKLLKMGENAYRFSRKYNWSYAIKTLNEVITNI